MTNKRKVYLRKKENRFIFETKVGGKSTYLWTIPTNYENFLKKLCKSSFFPKDKGMKILTILESADYQNNKDNIIGPKGSDSKNYANSGKGR